MVDLIIYSFLFVALFYEVFLVLTFFDRDAKRRRVLPFAETFPNVSIIVPCHNEEATLGATVESLLALEYPKEKLDIILVDDGSTDNTARVMERYRSEPRIQIIQKKNGGKHTALNAGIAITQSEFIGCLDADSFVEPDALRHVMSNFDDPAIGAVTASMSVHAPKGVIEWMQQAEYLLGIVLRHSLAALNGLYVTPGPFTIFRREVFEKIGVFKPAHNTEDMEIAMRMQTKGWKIQNAPQARVFTKAPRNVFALIKQRTRWTTGFIRNAIDYKHLFGNPRFGAVGLIVMPFVMLSIYFRMVVLPISWYHFGHSVWMFVKHAWELPLQFLFRMPSFDWFFAPISTISIVSLIVLSLTLIFMFLGAHISRTRTNIGFSIIWYLALYGLIAPLWIIRSVADVAWGVRRNWR